MSSGVPWRVVRMRWEEVADEGRRTAQPQVLVTFWKTFPLVEGGIGGALLGCIVAWVWFARFEGVVPPGEV